MSEFCCSDLRYKVKDNKLFVHDTIHGKIYIKIGEGMKLMKYCVYCGVKQ